MDLHAVRLDALLSQLQSTPAGLSSREAARRLQQYGPNALKTVPPVPVWRRFLAQFQSALVVLLLVAAAVAGFLGEWLDAAAIGVIVLLNAVFGFVQESRAENALAALQKLAALKANVLRDGVETALDAQYLVPGDVVMLPEGAKVPADCRLVQSYSLEVDEASLTGESEPADKDARARVASDAGLADRDNCVYLGTAVRRGRAVALVVRTGMDTELGRIARWVQSAGEPLTPLQVKLDQLGKRLGFLALAVCAVVFLSGLGQGLPLPDIFLISVSLAVAAVPEGLPAVVTITLAVGVQRMARRNALVRKLPAIETLGCATVICTDKTGTLTKNEMTVRHVYVDGGVLDVEGSGYSLEGRILQNAKTAVRTPALDRLARCAALCNASSLTAEGVVGDSMEGALLVLAHKAGTLPERLRESGRLVEEIPFSSERKMMSVRWNARGVPPAVYTKGAPDVVLARCSQVLAHGRTHALTAADKSRILAQEAAFAAGGLRVLALAYRDDAKSRFGGALESRLVFLGLVALNDPPREEVRESVRQAHAAGIRVVMITGDHPLTAKAIALEIGLDARRVVEGRDVTACADADLDRLASAVSVFARVSPEDKWRIVASLKRQGHVVAVTGDGVNDAPAVKIADIGVAMGITGTDVTKDAADMVIADDRFTSIVAAVEEGRTVYDNIVKSVLYLVACNFGEILTIFSAIVLGLGRSLGIESPLLPIQILWMNLVTDGLPALALGMEPREPDVMRRRPRALHDAVFSRTRLVRVALSGAWMAVGTLALYAAYLSGQPSKAVTVAFCTLIFFQLFFALSSRSQRHPLWRLGLLGNRWLWAAVLSAAAFQVATVQWSVLEVIFKTVPLDVVDWLAIVLVSASLSIALEVFKAFQNHE